MVANGISSLKRSVAVSAMVCGALAGCASTQQQVVQADVPHRVTTDVATATVSGPTTMSAVAYPNQPSTSMTTAVVSKSDRVVQTNPQTATSGSEMQDRMGSAAPQAANANGAQMAIASATGSTMAAPSASAAYASDEGALIPSVVALPTPNPARADDMSLAPLAAGTVAVSDGSIPLTPEMVAIQSVVPTPRPGEAFSGAQVAFATPAPELASLVYNNSAPHYDFNFDTSGPTVVPAVFEPSPDAEARVPAQEKGYISELISKYAKIYQVPAELIHRVVNRESRYDPKAFNHNGYFGLMQIKYNTAKSMGYQGPASGLFDAETNIKYAAKYLRGAWMVADNKQDTAVALYAHGYYYNAKNKGMDDIANGNY